MTADRQLERSVLEGKERDELSAIAQAMSLKTTSRTKKADIIDQILDATGVTPGRFNGGGNGQANGGAGANGDGNGAKPARRSRAAATTAEAEPVPSGDGGSAEVVGAAQAEATPAVPTASEAASAPDAGPAVFVEPPELADGAEAGPRPQGQGQQTNRNRGNQNQGRQPDGEPGNRRSRRRRGRERGQGGELQGGGQEQPYSGELVDVKGFLDLRDEGYGFLRCEGYLPSSKDVYVSISQARKFALRRGDHVEGASRPASNNEKYPALLRIDRVSGLDTEEARHRPRFEDLTPLFPDSRLNLEMPGEKENLTPRIVDLLSPIGKGQRGMIVSPPKAGKTTVMKQIAHSIEANNPEVHLMVLLVDERPEEVTDMRRSVKGEVVASTFDRPSDEHTQVAELAIERAKRLVEMGKDVVIILDGITRLARAYNLAAPATGRIMSGGVDSGALYPPKKFFGAARNVEEGGSLTILATALVETGSKMDEVIFEEFKGTGNMELRLDRRLAERRLYPAIDVNASSTRHEELLFERGQLQQVWKLRRVLNALATEGKEAAGLELLMDKIRTTVSNDEFLAEIAKGPGA
ncbi:MAG TPA: transcription termination factor Rho [Acidimicrobiales bacterium]|nr:transcription termination factor Rho [Acidimicrobiales bacterium]